MRLGFTAAVLAGASGAMAGLGYYLTITGKLTADTGWGRGVRPLDPFSVQVGAPAPTVFGVIAAPYLGRTSRGAVHESSRRRLRSSGGACASLRSSRAAG